MLVCSFCRIVRDTWDSLKNMQKTCGTCCFVERSHKNNSNTQTKNDNNLDHTNTYMHALARTHYDRIWYIIWACHLFPYSLFPLYLCHFFAVIFDPFAVACHFYSALCFCYCCCCCYSFHSLWHDRYTLTQCNYQKRRRTDKYAINEREFKRACVRASVCASKVFSMNRFLFLVERKSLLAVSFWASAWRDGVYGVFLSSWPKTKANTHIFLYHMGYQVSLVCKWYAKPHTYALRKTNRKY